MMLKEELGDIFYNVNDRFDVGSHPSALALVGIDSRPSLRGSTDPEQKSLERDFHEGRSISLQNTELSSG